MDIYTQDQIKNATNGELRNMRDCLEAHIDTMRGGIVRKPYLMNHIDVCNEMQNRLNAAWAIRNSAK